MPFTFNFYNAGHTAAFVNSDGNVTFEEEDRASVERNVARLLTGPAACRRFSPIWIRPPHGRVYVNAAADQYTVTWCSVRGFDSAQTITVADDAASERHDRNEVRRLQPR